MSADAQFDEAVAKHQGDSNARRYKAGDTLARAYRVLHGFEAVLASSMSSSIRPRIGSYSRPLKGASSHASEFRQEAATWVRVGAHPHIVQAHWVNEIAGMRYPPVSDLLVDFERASAVTTPEVSGA